MTTFVCTKETPWKKGMEVDRVNHPDAVEQDGPCDDFEYYKCPHCGLYFKVELPQ